MKALYPLILLLFFQCKSEKVSQQTKLEARPVAYEAKYELQSKGGEKEVDQHNFVETIAFGSCSNQDKKQVMWQYVLQNKPDVWIWLGDIIYGDTENMDTMKKKYDKQKSDQRYQLLREKCEIFGIWDDHDFGENDGYKDYPKKKESKMLMLDFLDVPSDAAVFLREGAYQSYEVGQGKEKIKIILLDGRYFRDKLVKRLNGLMRYHPNFEGDMLGEEQWRWLEKELSNSDAQVNLICSGVQVIAEEHGFEKWANFPNSRKRLLDLISKTNPTNPILLSGDRHIGEVSKIELEGLDTPLFDVTSSGLTHTVPMKIGKKEPNQFRVGERIQKKNFGVLRFNWSTDPVTVDVEIRGLENELFQKERLVNLN